jgi:hypothetical protein
LTIKVDIKILLKGIFGFIAFGGILVVVGEMSNKPGISEAGLIIMVIGGFILVLPLIRAILRKRGTI